MPSGLKGALLGMGNPLLDISAGASHAPTSRANPIPSRCVRAATTLAWRRLLASRAWLRAALAAAHAARAALVATPLWAF